MCSARAIRIAYVLAVAMASPYQQQLAQNASGSLSFSDFDHLRVLKASRMPSALRQWHEHGQVTENYEAISPVSVSDPHGAVPGVLAVRRE